ncbi:flagellar protein FlaG [Catenovulum sp. 2E275]|uniref:flagellar protein FlaG n=1 Tax=Catenovulum sp. 2E275 TaxID=2980497 RepID=UPI0021CE28DB|nr:flagellar protein FlaG [Catenovulum sp. 2E275]MCU4674764.1 flagellar protein FlaG [Catenovulum sp. 2E275]
MEIQASQISGYFANLVNGQNTTNKTKLESEQSSLANSTHSDDKLSLASGVVNTSTQNVDNGRDESNTKGSVSEQKLVSNTKVTTDTADILSITTEEGFAQIENALSQVTDFIQLQNRQLNFSFDEDSNRSIIKVTDSDSGDVIRQIPSEDVLKLAQRIKELQTDAGEAIGVLVNRQV